MHVSKKTVSELRRAVDEAEALLVFLLVSVNSETAFDPIFEVTVDSAGVVLDLDLPHPGDTQQHVLVVDERRVSAFQGLVIVPRCPVESVQQWALGELFIKRKSLICTFLCVLSDFYPSA